MSKKVSCLTICLAGVPRELQNFGAECLYVTAATRLTFPLPLELRRWLDRWARSSWVDMLLPNFPVSRIAWPMADLRFEVD